MPPHTLPVLVLLVASAAPAPPAESPLTFEDHVRPILKAYCFDCHGEQKKLRGSLDVRLRRLLLEGGDRGPAVVPGKPAASLLYQRVLKGEMPPGKVKLPAHEAAVLARWIEGGAHVRGPEPDKLAPGPHISALERGFWAFQPIRRPAVPVVKQADRVRNPVDAFLLARLEGAGLSFAPEADRLALLRRASFDLTGLPPTPEEVDDFLADTRPDAYERLIDRLLDSPHYGERWARHWLDVVGYADSDGASSADPVRPYAWKYRDYVIRSLNADKPFDRFIVEQLAGDELVGPPSRAGLGVGPPSRGGREKGAARLAAPTAPDLELLTATGFLRMAPDGSGVPGADRKVAAHEVLADTVQIVSASLLGLTVQCARCHNHRYDPIPQSDYYALRAVFEPALDPANWRTPPGRLLSLTTEAQKQQSAAIEAEAVKIDAERLKKQEGYIEQTFRKQLLKVPEGVRTEVEKAYRTPVPKRTAEQQKLLQEHPSVNVSAGSLYLYDSKAAADLKSYADRAAKLRATKPPADFLAVLTEVPGAPLPATRVLHRGDPDQPREEVAPGGLSVLAPLGLGAIPAKEPGLPTSGRRLAFARQLTSGKHPLTPRVLVNRVWMEHFGKGIVATPADFGKLGERPTHPELLDYLATELVRSGWSLKKLHRLLLTSAAYRQSSRQHRLAQKLDPDNRLLSRMPLRRLEAEAVRDAMLATSGMLNPKLFGKPVPVMPDEVGQVVLGVDNRDGAGYPRGKPVALGDEEFRRSVYVQVRRSMTLGVLETFDAPVVSPTCECRTPSTVATQSLFLMNNAFLVQQARQFAARVREEAGPEDGARVARAWKLAYARPASERDLSAAVEFLAEQTRIYRALKKPQPEQLALAALCQALLGSNGFLYVD